MTALRYYTVVVRFPIWKYRHLAQLMIDDLVWQRYEPNHLILGVRAIVAAAGPTGALNAAQEAFEQVTLHRADLRHGKLDVAAFLWSVRLQNTTTIEVAASIVEKVLDETTVES